MPDVIVHLERSAIPTVGQPTIGAFLKALQVHKSLADVEAGTAMYNKYSEVTPEMAALRAIVMARKEPRKLLVQPVMRRTESADGETNGEPTYSIESFAESREGMVASFVARYPAEDEELLALWRADKPHVTD